MNNSNNDKTVDCKCKHQRSVFVPSWIVEAMEEERMAEQIAKMIEQSIKNQESKEVPEQNKSKNENKQ